MENHNHLFTKRGTVARVSGGSRGIGETTAAALVAHDVKICIPWRKVSPRKTEAGDSGLVAAG